jgi:Iap family predicted aminopeptidase
MKRQVSLLLAICVLILLLPSVAFATPTYEHAVNTLLSAGYPQSVENHLDSLGTSPMGFRYTGSPSDNAAAQYIARQMRASGLVHVRLEPVPVDAYNFRGANVVVGSRYLPASTFGGVTATPAGGLSGDIVYAHYGTASDFAALGDVTGKLVLVDMKMSSWWLNLPCAEATLRGAKGVILTFTPDDPTYYATYTALGSFDGYYDQSWVPAVYVSWKSGDWLKAQLETGPVSGTMTNDVTMTMANNGGRGYNVVGELPGSVKNGQMTLISAHHDAYFRAGLDDTSAVAQQLLIAKAMKKSHYRPHRTIVFLTTTAEEYGYTNAYYEWCIGAWWAITHAHAKWAGHIALQLNLEAQGQREAALQFRPVPEIRPWLLAQIAAHPALFPYGTTVDKTVASWNDQWTFTAAGVPSLYFGTNDDYEGSHFYHTQFDTPGLIDWKYLGMNSKFEFMVAKAFDSGLLPFDPAARADHLGATVDDTRLLAAGADAAVVSSLSANLTAFKTAAAAYNGRKASLAASKIPAVNAGLLRIEKDMNKSWIALGPYDGTIYPHQQVLIDVEGLKTAVDELQKPAPDKDVALGGLGNVDLTWYGQNFSHATYVKELTRHDPSYYRITWGGQGHLPVPLDVMPEYNQIVAGHYAAALSSLQPKLTAEVTELNARLTAISDLLASLTTQVNALK